MQSIDAGGGDAGAALLQHGSACALGHPWRDLAPTGTRLDVGVQNQSGPFAFRACDG